MSVAIVTVAAAPACASAASETFHLVNDLGVPQVGYEFTAGDFSCTEGPAGGTCTGPMMPNVTDAAGNLTLPVTAGQTLQLGSSE